MTFNYPEQVEILSKMDFNERSLKSLFQYIGMDVFE